MQGEDRPNLYLTGFMGSGKTSVGRYLAQRLKYQFMDSDAEIAKKAQKSITEIFNTEGEEAFRKWEKWFAEKGHPTEEMVVATGGGMVTHDCIGNTLKQNGHVYVLCASPEHVYERTCRHSHRPLLNVEKPLDRIRELMREREKYYREAGIQIMTDNRPIKEIVEHILRIHHRSI